ncbi:hypothetical protein [Bacillus sp. B-jedd]|uniref:hypothetical protein n=1 Tax=Bacillus sp. B-jedd TaxID=1476857 RepID=UPI00051567DE|nr:hypothetical protein [Bacillus sp. B-jedd]CEG26633.1 hypothetical protein BN1002_01483 [Bacillus sp. B-jedd]
MISIVRRPWLMAGIVTILFFLAGCGLFADKDLIADRYAEAHLTNNNELQFRFKIQDKLLQGQDMYKIRILIHNPKLAEALGTEEIIYGEEQVVNGEFLEVKKKGDNYISMEPLPLLLDLHIAELEKMIAAENAVSIELYNEEQVFGRAYLTNFSSSM